MKKLVAIVLAVSLLLPAVAFAASTDARGAFELCELFYQRFTELVRDNELDYELYIGTDFVTSSAPPGMINIIISAGSMTINEDDFTVHKLMMELYNDHASGEENKKNVAICIAAFSALEYDYAKNNLFEQTYELIGGPANAIEASRDVWNDEILPILSAETFQKAVDTKEDILIYTGNYRYYLNYISGTYDGKEQSSFTLTAEEYK